MLTTEKSHLEDEIKMLETTVSNQQTELESNELTKMKVWKDDDDDIVTERLAEYTSVSKGNPKGPAASKRYCTLYMHS